MLYWEQRLEAWHERTHGRVALAATYRKLLEEVGELGEQLIQKNNFCAREEAADALAVLAHLLCDLGSGIEDALEFAVTKVEEREEAAEKARG